MNVMIYNKFKEILSNLNIDVMRKVEGMFNVDEIIDQFKDFYYDKMILDITAIRDYQNIDNLQKLAMNLNMENVILYLDNNETCNSQTFLSHLISLGIYNFTKDVEGINYLLVHPHSYRDVVNIHNVSEIEEKTAEVNKSSVNIDVSLSSGQKIKIIGFKNLTMHAGSTSLIYMIKKCLEGSTNVCAIEIGKTDFIFFNDPNMISTTSEGLLKELMTRQNYDVILIDLNDYKDFEICTKVIYLIEPSTIMFTRLCKVNNNILNTLKDKDVVLNKCQLNSEDVYTFEYETKLKTLFTLPSLNDRDTDIPQIREFTSRLGL